MILEGVHASNQVQYDGEQVKQGAWKEVWHQISWLRMSSGRSGITICGQRPYMGAGLRECQHSKRA